MHLHVHAEETSWVPHTANLKSLQDVPCTLHSTAASPRGLVACGRTLCAAPVSTWATVVSSKRTSPSWQNHTLILRVMAASPLFLKDRWGRVARAECARMHALSSTYCGMSLQNSSIARLPFDVSRGIPARCTTLALPAVGSGVPLPDDANCFVMQDRST